MQRSLVTESLFPAQFTEEWKFSQDTSLSEQSSPHTHIQLWSLKAQKQAGHQKWKPEHSEIIFEEIINKELWEKKKLRRSKE